LSRRESLQIGALSLLGLLAPGSAKPAEAAALPAAAGAAAVASQGAK
jgi:hypothetical protein